ncbi:MAG: ATP-binding cassette domain-containing protein [Proteobacteria bacterium]|nr:ATP-binding cassette domain-containing protein [Pseudomonadota bacterium]
MSARPSVPFDRGERVLAAEVIRLTSVGLTLRSRAGDVEILKAIDLSVPYGQSLAIVGPSGSGKTSMLMLIGGLERASRGRIEVAGRDFTGLDEDQLARVRSEAIGVVFQSFHLVATMTALENVALPLEFRGSEDARERAERALVEVGLGHRLEHFPAELSGGEQQRVALARAVVSEPKLLLADEPTGNLDSATGRQVIDLIFALGRRHGTTLVLVTHDESLAQRCERVIRMADGRIVSDTSSARAVAVEAGA